MLINFKSFVMAILKNNNSSVNQLAGQLDTTSQNLYEKLGRMSKRIDEADKFLNELGYTITFEKLK